VCGAYPLGAADDSTFDFDGCRLEPAASSQGGSSGMSIEVLLPDDRWSHCSRPNKRTLYVASKNL